MIVKTCPFDDTEAGENVNIVQVAGALGALIDGIALNRPLSPGDADTLRQALRRHHVLFFRDQALTPQQHIDFTRTFAQPGLYPFIQGLPDAPEVIEIIKSETDQINFGGTWHSDTAYLPEPAIGTVLHAIQVPDAGGDTLFANTAAAYDGLSQGLQSSLKQLIGVNHSDLSYGGSRQRAMAKLGEMKQDDSHGESSYESEHPVVRTHPETGRKSLYVSRTHTSHFKNMSHEESRRLLGYLTDHIERPEYTCRFHWTNGAVAVWDNRITQHYALNDYAGSRRHMRRVTMCGERPQ